MCERVGGINYSRACVPCTSGINFAQHKQQRAAAVFSSAPPIDTSNDWLKGCTHNLYQPSCTAFFIKNQARIVVRKNFAFERWKFWR